MLFFKSGDLLLLLAKLEYLSARVNDLERRLDERDREERAQLWGLRRTLVFSLFGLAATIVGAVLLALMST